MPDEILWINHAGYELRSNGVRIVHDPWLSGLAFADGWALIAESRYQPADFAGVDYIWFSHEHPDHFVPGMLREIPEDVRRTITVLFQKTKDGRVVSFCRKLGFSVQELIPGERTPLKGGIRATCGCAGYDSWLFMETLEKTYFNANDVVGVNWPAIAAKLPRPVDVLLTQFSYAGWVGNPEQGEVKARHAAQKIVEMTKQVEAFDPRILIPFASYVWFCRDENFHMNEQANRIDAIVELWRSRVETVVLYPGDICRVGEPFDTDSAVARYLQDCQRHDRPLQASDPVVKLAELRQVSAEHQRRLRDDNALWLLKPLQLLGYVTPVAVYFTDLDTGIVYNMFGGILREGLTRTECEIEMLSGSFANALRNGYGYTTLSINGRFRELVGDASLRLGRHFAIPAQNEQGYRVPDVFLRREYVLMHARRMLAGLWRKVAPSGG